MSEHHVTIVSAEVQGLEELSKREDATQAAQLMRTVFDLVSREVELYNGRIFLVNGSNLMAAFGYGNGKPDHVSMSVKCAEGIREKLNTFCQDIEDTLYFRAGLEAGKVFINEISTGSQTQLNVIGEPVNLAGRILDMAEKGQILAGPELNRLLKDDREFIALEPVPLKGYKKPLPLFEVSTKKERAGKVPLQSGRMISSRMIGRDKELKLLEKQVLQLINGRGSVVNIEGIAGIGKSRLMAEIMQKDIMENIAFFQGRALSEGSNLSFHPITHIIRSWAGITENDPGPEAASKLKNSIRRIMPETAGEVFPFIATMMGLSFDGEARQRLEGIKGEALEKLILKNLRELIARAAALRPVIIVLEDAHWADQSSVYFMESLFKLVRTNRLMFVNVFRPGYKNTGERIRKSVRESLPDHHVEMVLEPLTAEQTAELINGLLQQVKLPGEITALITHRAAGNPFFVEEVIRSFIDEGLIEVKKNTFVLTEKIKYANIPESIDKVLLSRIDRLDEKTKNLLKTASVIGRNFYYKVLEEAAKTIGELDEKLEYLKDVQLLNERKGKDEVEFLFKHALAQQATYDSIVEKTRKELHLKIARSIERVFADRLHEFYGTLAHHYTKADVPDKVLDYLVKAGDESLHAGAPSEALDFLKQARRRLPDEPSTAEEKELVKDIDVKMAFAHSSLGNNLESRKLFEHVMSRHYGFNFRISERWMKLQGALNMLWSMFAIHNQRWFFKKAITDEFNELARMQKEWTEAVTTQNARQWAFLAFRLARYLVGHNLADSPRGVTLFVEGSSLYMWTGLSFKTSQKILDYGRDAGVEQYPFAVPTYRVARKMHEYMTGTFYVDKDLNKIFHSGLQIGEFFPLSIYLLYTGMVCAELGDHKGFLDCMEKYSEISEVVDNNHTRAQLFRLSVLGYYRFRKLDKALEVAMEGVRYISKTGHESSLLVVYGTLAQIHAENGRLDEAKKAYMEAGRMVNAHKIITIYHVPYLLAKARVEFLELQLKQGAPDRQSVKQLFATSDKLIARSKKLIASLPEAYLIRARIHWFLKQYKKSLRYFELAVATGEKHNTRVTLARVYFELGKCLHEPECGRSNLRGNNASEYLQKARAMFAEMDLQWDMERLEEYMDSR